MVANLENAEELASDEVIFEETTEESSGELVSHTDNDPYMIWNPEGKY